MQDRGVHVDHSTIGRWVAKYTPEIVRKALHKKRTIGSSWRMDETYIKIRGEDAYLFRAVDKADRIRAFPFLRGLEENSSLCGGWQVRMLTRIVR